MQSVMTPLICATTIQTPYWAGMSAFVIISAFWSINYIAVELEMPFGDDLNDLPIYEMQRDMNQSLLTLMNDVAQNVPGFEYSPEVDAMLTLSEIDFDCNF